MNKNSNSYKACLRNILMHIELVKIINDTKQISEDSSLIESATSSIFSEDIFAELEEARAEEEIAPALIIEELATKNEMYESEFPYR